MKVQAGHLLREQGVGSSNLPAPTSFFSYLALQSRSPGALWGAFSPGSTFLLLTRRALELVA